MKQITKLSIESHNQALPTVLRSDDAKNQPHFPPFSKIEIAQPSADIEKPARRKDVGRVYGTHIAEPIKTAKSLANTDRSSGVARVISIRLTGTVEGD
ncbi:hypothetical protein [Bifidobacterium sp. UTCIF-39]|uniref:hypothetical protein n=1 Tax=Bifidobacterium sp. UTCIF-39 TaxID=1465359 RepID=UPI00112B5BDE|nr:hypothetical protein [Bifidobacterium sp. UTCIF-39]